MNLLFISLLGLTIGSFLNVCIYRLPQDQSIIKPRSHCPSCGHTLQAKDLLPLISWFLLRGRCRYCSIQISPRYSAIEALTAILYVVAYLQIGLAPELIRALFLISFLIVIAIIDYDRQLILDNILLCMSITGVAFMGFLPSTFQQSLLGALAGTGTMLLLRLISRGRMGDGDALLAGVLGLWFGWRYVAITLYCSFLLGGIAALFLLARSRRTNQRLPFAPFLNIAAFFVYIMMIA